MALDLVCVGDATRDLFLFIEEATAKGGKLELEYGGKIPVSQIAWSLGGNAANVSIGLSRLGLSTSLVTVFGDDDRGAWIKRELLKNNVDLSFSFVEPQRQSNLSAVVVFESERTILSFHSKGSKQIETIPDAAWIYLTSAPDKDSSGLFRLVSEKKKASPETKVVFNPYVEDLRRGKDYLAPILQVVDILIVNREEGAMLVGVSISLEEEAKALGQLGPKAVLITDGPDGATVFDGARCIHKAALKTVVVEATGAGDAFSSGFLAALFYGKDLEMALDWGLKNSTSVIGKIGAIDGLLTKDQLC